MRLLEQSKLVLDSILNSIGSGVIVSDSDGNFLVFNPAAERMFGIGATTGGQSTWVETYGFYAEDGVTPLQESELPLVRAMNGEEIDGLRVYVKNHHTEKGLWVSVNGRPLINDKGDVNGGVIVFEDITRQRTLEQELLRSNDSLQQFASVAAHDLQEPLRTILSFLDLLSKRQKDTLDEKSLRYVNFINDAGVRMQDLISDLLTYSRIQTRAKPFTQVDCKEVLSEVIANLDSSIKAQDAVIDVDTLPTINADKGQIGQVFQNLIGNSLKFKGHERPRVSVKACRKDDSWLFSVEDNGIGIAPEYYQRIFGIFQRLHAIDQYPGSGIGLALCKSIVERHNGRIWLESQPGLGTTFYFTIGTENHG